MKRTFLTIAFILYTALILFLSFQQGGDTADTSMRFTKFILGLFVEGDIPYDVLEYWHMTFRLLAHPVLFGIYSVLVMSITMECTKKRWIGVVLSGISGVLLAVLTEVGKYNIPGRHFDLEEMWLNVAGVIGGMLVYAMAARMGNVLVEKSRVIMK